MRLEVQVAGKRFNVEVAAESVEAKRRKRAQSSIQSFPLPTAQGGGEEDHICRSPVNGIVARVLVQVGDTVRVHDPMLVLEAMKMQTKLTARVSARLKCVHVAPGQAVRANQVLLEFD